MSSGGTKRKLTTIMAADVVGYSRLVAADDEATIRRLQQSREIIGSILQRHDGRLFSEAGDSMMAEFPSAVEAVRCALEIQEEIAARNTDAPPDRAMLFRIGIDIGEIIIEGDNLYGDGVNIAARLQEIADPGGIVLSAAAYDQIKNKVTVDIEPLGPRSLKNIPQPVTAFRVRVTPRAPVASFAMDSRTGFGWKRRAVAGAAGILALIGGFVAWDVWVDPGSRLEVFKAQAAQPVPAVPSIVVMPFLNASENEAQDYFCLGMSEDIITSLTKVSGLFVVGRDSAMSLKGKAIPARQIGRDLGVRYVLQGSVRRAENRVRISTYLVDAATEQTVWAARYDRELGDIFAVQDDITGKIVNALSVSFRPGEQDSIRQQLAMAPKVDVYDLFLQGRKKLYPPTQDNLAEAEKLFEKVIAVDDKFADGHAGLSLVYSLRVNQGYVRSASEAQETLAKAEASAKKALDRNAGSAMAMFAAAEAALLNHKTDQAVDYARKAYLAQPGDAYVAATLGFILTFAGKPQEAYYPIERAIELERVPEYQSRAQFFKIFAAYEAGDYVTAGQAYATHFNAGFVCQAHCLAYTAASKLLLAEKSGNDADRAERDAETANRDAEKADRDAAIAKSEAERAKLIGERDRLRTERDRLRAERDKLTADKVRFTEETKRVAKTLMDGNSFYFRRLDPWKKMYADPERARRFEETAVRAAALN